MEGNDYPYKHDTLDSVRDKLPQRPEEHVIGDRADRVFGFRIKKEWITQKSEKDYGWDILTTITKEKRVKEDFFVQLKGHNKPNFIENNNFISEQLQVSTVRWLLSKFMPSMLCICDEANSDEPIYYQWINEFIDEIIKTKPDWEKQDYINIRIPTDNILDESSHRKIEECVSNFYTELRINKSISEILNPPERFTPEILNSYRDSPDQFVLENIAPTLKEFGLIDINDTEGTKTYSGKELEISKTLKEVSVLINELHDLEAEKKLRSIEDSINQAHDSLKAQYFNSKGVVALHSLNDTEALEWFEKACSLRSNEPKYLTNYLLVKIHFTRTEQDKAEVEEYISKIDKLLEKKPDYFPAIRLKAYCLAEIYSIDNVYTFLERSRAFEKEPLASKIFLADIYKEHCFIDKAIEVLSQIKDSETELDENYYSLYGFLLLAKALGSNNSIKEMVIHGGGPSQLDLSLLKQSCDCYERSYNLLASRGFPKIFESAIVNYAMVLNLLAYYEKADTVCKSYLQHYPDSALINGALASSLFNQHNFPKALHYSKLVYNRNQEASLAFKNYILCLYLMEDYENVLTLIKSRMELGFKDKKEEGLARTFAAMAYQKLGIDDLAKKQVQIMQGDAELKIDAIIAECELTSDNEEAKKIYWTALSENADNLMLMNNLLSELLPVNKDNAQELIELFEKIIPHRQLLPDEYFELGRCYLLQNIPEKAEDVFRKGIERYPSVQKFILEHAISLFQLGLEEESYEELEAYLKEGEKSYTILVNIAQIAMETGRIDNAITFLDKALRKTSEDKNKGKIHCLLYELKRREQFPSKELLFHIVEFGKTIDNEPELEARYLMMFLSTPITKSEIDNEIINWIEEFKKRNGEFTKAYPKFPAFRMFTFSEGASDEEKAQDILSTIVSMSLSHHLATSCAKIATRTGEWPLTFRAEYLYSRSVFDYWSQCVRSKEAQHCIHIWREFNNLIEEISYAKESKICVDLTALLTLAEFEMLDVLKVFKQVFISWGTKISIDKEVNGLKPTNPLAKKIYDWKNANRAIVRVRSAINEYEPEDVLTGYRLNTLGIYLKNEASIQHLLGNGIGETIILAQKLEIPLYSDESFVRNISKTHYDIKSFSTIGLIKALRDEGTVLLDDETLLFSQMINKNFISIPFSADHLQNRLKHLIENISNTENRYLKSDALINDDILISFLRQFGEQSLYPSIILIAIEWWIQIMSDSQIPDEQLGESVSYVSYIISMRSTSTVINRKIYKDEQFERMGIISAIFLWKSYLKNENFVVRSWSAIKSCCDRYFREMGDEVLFKYIPKHLKVIIENERTMNDNQKVTVLYEMTKQLSDSDKLQEFFMKNKPNFIS